MQTIIKNKKANFNYFIESKFEAGIVLQGSEIKAIRLSKCSIEESHASYVKGEVFLFNMHIAQYEKASYFNHSPTRPRKLLLHKIEIKKILGKIKLKGYTLVPLSLYFNDQNIVKLELGVGKGKKLHDKRQDIKNRDWDKQKARTLKSNFRD